MGNRAGLFNSEEQVNRNQRKNLIRKIWVEQKGICHLCNKPVELRMASIDHVLPKSKGGPDRRENYKVAHLLCNNIRGSEEIDSPDYYIEQTKQIKNLNFALPKNF